MTTFDAAVHVEVFHDEIVNSKNALFCAELYDSKFGDLSSAKRRERRVAMANCLKIPNNARLNQRQLAWNLSKVAGMVSRAFAVKTHNLRPGVKVQIRSGETVEISSIRRDFNLALCGRTGAFNPEGVSPL